MGAVVRSFAVGPVILVAACASLAGIEEPDPSGASVPSSSTNASEGPTSASETGDSGNDSAPSATPGAPILDASDDADGATEPPPLPAGCQPPKKGNGATCAASSECCSGACSAVGRCRSDCHEDEDDGCNPFADSCCIGLFCLPGFASKCKKCREAGEKPEINEEKACCSRMLDGDGKCL